MSGKRARQRRKRGERQERSLVVEKLDDSTTGTSFHYLARGPDVQPPSATMRMVAEVASERDRLWFEQNPVRDYRVRWSLPGEFSTDGLETVRGSLTPEEGRFVTVVLQLAPGTRRRIDTLFMDGSRIREPIPEAVWPEFYKVAKAEDREAALRKLIEERYS